jgi:hypothetical protein
MMKMHIGMRLQFYADYLETNVVKVVEVPEAVAALIGGEVPDSIWSGGGVHPGLGTAAALHMDGSVGEKGITQCRAGNGQLPDAPALPDTKTG